MSKKVKKQYKKKKKAVVGVIPTWCTCSNFCCVALLALVIGLGFMGGMFDVNGDDDDTTTTTTDTTTDTTTTTTTTHEGPVLYKLAIQIYSWTHEPGYTAEDMTFEIWKLSSYTGVGSGEWWGVLYLSYIGSPWAYSTESEHFTYGTPVAIDMFITPNNHNLDTSDSFLQTTVGAPEAKYPIFQNGIHTLDILLKWVVI